MRHPGVGLGFAGMGIGLAPWVVDGLGVSLPQWAFIGLGVLAIAMVVGGVVMVVMEVRKRRDDDERRASTAPPLAKRCAALHREACAFLERRDRNRPVDGPDPLPDRTQPGGGQEWLDALQRKRHEYHERSSAYDRVTYNEFLRVFAPRISKLVDDAHNVGEFVDPKLESRYESLVNLLVCRQAVVLLGAMGERLADEANPTSGNG